MNTLRLVKEKCKLEKHPWICRMVQCLIGVILGNAIVYVVVLA